MASDLYTVAEKGFLDGDLDMLADTIRVRATSTDDYTYNAADTSMTPVTAYSGTTDATLSSKSTSGGVFDAGDLAPAYTAVSQDSTKTIDGLVIFKFDTDDASSTPIGYIDLSVSPSVVVTPNGGDVNITWNASGIFDISVQ